MCGQKSDKGYIKQHIISRDFTTFFIAFPQESDILLGDEPKADKVRSVLPLYIFLIGIFLVVLAFTLPTIIRDRRRRQQK